MLAWSIYITVVEWMGIILVDNFLLPTNANVTSTPIGVEGESGRKPQSGGLILFV